jgi:hypothetical protein
MISLRTFICPTCIPDSHVFFIFDNIFRHSPIGNIVNLTRKNILVFNKATHFVIVILVPTFTSVGVKPTSPSVVDFIPNFIGKLCIVTFLQSFNIGPILQFIQSFFRRILISSFPLFQKFIIDTNHFKNLIQLIARSVFPEVHSKIKIKKILRRDLPRTCARFTNDQQKEQ